jgi:hypothetical protein
MSKKQIGILIAPDWDAAFLSMTDKEAGALIKAIIAWKNGTENAAELPRAAAPIFPLLIAQQERNLEKYRDICEKRQAAALKRWEKDQNKEKSELDNAEKSNSNANNQQTNANDMQLHPNGMQMEPNRNRNRNRNRNVSKDTILLSDFEKISVFDKIKLGLNDFFRRKESTPWTDKELGKLAKVAKRPEALKESRAILGHYRGGYEYHYKAIETLLNNWTTACDRASAAGFTGEAGETGSIAGHSPDADYGL